MTFPMACIIPGQLIVFIFLGHIAVFENRFGTGHVVFVEKVDGNTIWFNEANHHKKESYDGAIESQSISDFKNRSKAF